MSSNDLDRHYYSAADIYGVLRALQTDRSSVNIQFEGDARPYSSMVLDANLQERYFLLDEPTPRDIRQRIENGAPFSLRASVNGIRVHARDLKSQGVLNDESGVSYRVTFPERLLYLQRRDAFRASVPVNMMAIANLASAAREKELRGRVANMSAEGIKIAFPGRVAPELAAGEQFTARIQIRAQDAALNCQLEIVYCEYSPETDRSVCGCRFINLQWTTQRLITRLVTSLQRERFE